MSVILSAGYRPLFVFFNVKEFSFIRSMDVQSMWLRQSIGLMDRVLGNGPVDLCSIPGRVIPKTLKMVLDTSLLNTQQYKIHIKGKVEQSRE